MDDYTTYWIISLFVAILLGLIPASIAVSKGRSFWGWWLFGAGFFILALPAAIIISPDTATIEKSQFERGYLKKCPYCAELVKKEAKVCKHCGRDLPDPHPGTVSGVDLSPLSKYLRQSEQLARTGEFRQAALVLEHALKIDLSWTSKVAGYPRQTTLMQGEPASGYALLVHLAGKADKKEFALRCFQRMLELNPKNPGDARQAAREAGIASEAKKVAKRKGVSWHWWEY